MPRRRALDDDGEEQRRVAQLDHGHEPAVGALHGPAGPAARAVGEGEAAAPRVRHHGVPLHRTVVALGQPEAEAQLAPGRVHGRRGAEDPDAALVGDGAERASMPRRDRDARGDRAEEHPEHDRDLEEDADDGAGEAAEEELTPEAAHRGTEGGGFHAWGQLNASRPLPLPARGRAGT